MKKIIILLSLLILLPLTATSKPLIPIMKTLFTDVISTKQRAGRGHVLHVFLLMVIDGNGIAQSVPTVKNIIFHKVISANPCKGE